jgi:hypothetical protein
VTKTKPKSTIGPDVDLDTEEVYLPDGSRLTNQMAVEMAERAMQEHYRARGRPSVTGKAERTPNLTVRVSPDTRQALEEIAAAQGRRLADVAREALERYVAYEIQVKGRLKMDPSLKPVLPVLSVQLSRADRKRLSDYARAEGIGPDRPAGEWLHFVLTKVGSAAIEMIDRTLTFKASTAVTTKKGTPARR